MKKISLSLALIPLMLSSNTLAASIVDSKDFKFDLFGNVEAFYANANSMYKYGYMHNSLQAQSNIGLAARSNLSSNLDAIAMYSFDSYKSSAETLTSAEYLYAGIDAYNYGQLLIGRGDSAYYTIIGANDIFDFIKSRNQNYYNALGEQRDSQLMYSLSALNSDLRISYQFATDNTKDELLSVEKSFAIAIYNQITDYISFAYGLEYVEYDYSNAQRNQINNDFFSKLLKYDYGIADKRVGDSLSYGLNLSYGYLGSGLYLSFIYSSTNYEYLKHHLDSYDLVAAYYFDNGIDLKLGYQTQRYDNNNLISDIALGLGYKVNNNFYLYAEALLDMSDKEHIAYDTKSKYYYDGSQYVAGAKFIF